ncbi:MAG: hypothetical protein Q8O67_01105 [Deltaproteobacteria bacterium]|nr:hypothetical protein [Deltaproteobacteria bacterium]
MTRGFSLLEVLIAAVLFIVCVTGVVSTWSSVAGLADTQVRRGEGITLAEDVLDDLRLCFRGSDDLRVGHHTRFFTRDRAAALVEDPRGYRVDWDVVAILDQSFKRIDLVVSWRGSDGRPHDFSFATYRPG